MWKPYDHKKARDILFDCGSDISKRTHEYLRYCETFMKPHGDVCSEMYGDIGLYYCTKAKTHYRLIEIAVISEKQHTGIGRIILYRLLRKMKENGVYRLTLQTPINESSKDFWLHIGARIIGINRGGIASKWN